MKRRIIDLETPDMDKFKKILPSIAKLFLFVWLGTITLFIAGVVMGSKQPNQVYPEVLSNFLIIDVITGVVSFIVMCLFALLGAITNPKERRFGLLKNEEDKKQKGSTNLKYYLMGGIALLLVAIGFLNQRATILELSKKVEDYESLKNTPVPSPTLSPTPTIRPKTVTSYKKSGFDGPQLWEAVNQRRIEHGVGTLQRNDNLCSIASFRLNELLVLGKLDNHAGFNALWQNPDSQFAWIFKKYQITEFLVYDSGGTALDAVNLWDNTMGHQILLRGGEFSIGCTYAQGGFGVAEAGY